MRCRQNILIVVDYQLDFADPLGALYVKGGELILNNVHKLIKHSNYFDYLVFTLDTHRESDYIDSLESRSFPVHCLHNTRGWGLYKIKPESYDKFCKININGPKDYIGKKNSFFVKDKFSIWEGNQSYSQFVSSKFHRDDNIFLCGLAENFCVSMHLNGLAKNGYNNLFLITDATAAIKGSVGFKLSAVSKLINTNTTINLIT